MLWLRADDVSGSAGGNVTSWPDASGAAKSTCDVVQEIGIPTSYSGPHLLGIDTATGELYAALVADSPKSTVLRFRMRCWGLGRRMC